MSNKVFKYEVSNDQVSLNCISYEFNDYIEASDFNACLTFKGEDLVSKMPVKAVAYEGKIYYEASLLIDLQSIYPISLLPTIRKFNFENFN